MNKKDLSDKHKRDQQQAVDLNALRQTKEYTSNAWRLATNQNRVEYHHLDDGVDMQEKQAINQTDWWKRMSGKMDIKVVLDLILEYPNDQELGGALRKYYLDVKKNA